MSNSTIHHSKRKARWYTKWESIEMFNGPNIISSDSGVSMDMNNSNMDILNELSEHLVLRMKSCLQVTHSRDWIEHKAHVYYDMWFVQAGTVNIHIDGVEYTANPGDIVFFYPGLSYMANTSKDGCRFIYVHFDFDIGGRQRILDDFRLSGIVPHALIQEDTGQFVSSYSRTQLTGNRLYLKACLMAVIAKIIEVYRNGQYRGAFPAGQMQKSERNLEFLHPVFDHVNQHIHAPIKMHDLASLIGMSEKYFITYFKRCVGITPGQYIYQIRMNRARDYLYEKRHTVQEIASLLGYPDPYSFSKAFKKYYNVPPSRFV